jgi:hypothetical protein
VIRTLLLLVGLGLCAAASAPSPWAVLWLAVPFAVAAALLLCWRWGAWGVLVPVVALAVVALAAGPLSVWSWWIPVAGLTGSWMGLREEGGNPASGRRAWMLLPVLLLAAGLPWTLPYPRMIANLGVQLEQGDRDMLQASRDIGYQGERLHNLERTVADVAALRRRCLPYAIPSVLFVWMALLVVAGRELASRIAARFHWPELSRGRLLDWRLPDGAIWLLMGGLALVLIGFRDSLPSAWTLLIVPALGYCVQGIAVVESVLLVRGVPPSVVVLTMLFVLLMAFPVFLPATVCVGLSDIWLDYRRLEAVPGGDLS